MAGFTICSRLNKKIVFNEQTLFAIHLRNKKLLNVEKKS